MNTIANTVATKLFVAFVAAAMLFTLATPAKAATMEELQAQIAALMAQISSMSGTTAAPATSAACTFTRALSIGTEGADVKCLQDYLTPKFFTNAGGSTGYYGAVTASAVAAWQTANAVTPASGMFGPLSQAKYTALMAAAPAPVTPTTPTTPSTDSSADSELSGEATLDTVEITDGEEADDVEEGSEDIQVAEITVNFADGDAEINRIDLALEVDSGNNGDDDPFDVFQDVSLWVDGDEVARMDASDEDDYLDEDDGSLRFSGLDIVAMEDEDVVITVAVTVNSSVDGVATSDDEDWNLAIGGIRFTDADGVTETDTTTGDLIDITDATLADPMAEFSIDLEGAGDDLDLETSSTDPEEKTIAVDEDSNVEDDIFAFELSAEDSDGEVTLNEITLTATVTVASSVDDLVNDFRLTIGDQSFDAESYTGTGMTATLVFDIDKKVKIAKDKVVTAVLYADFEDMEDADEGSTIVAGINASDVDAEGADDVTVDGSRVAGETHTVRTEGLSVDLVSAASAAAFTADDSGEKDTKKYTLVFNVTAIGDAMYIDKSVTRDDTTAGGADGDGFMWATTTDSTTGTTTVAATISAAGGTSDDTSTAYYIGEGETRKFTLAVTLEAGIDGSAAVKLTSINWTNDSTDTTPNFDHTTGFDDFKTDLDTLNVI